CGKALGREQTHGRYVRLLRCRAGLLDQLRRGSTIAVVDRLVVANGRRVLEYDGRTGVDAPDQHRIGATRPNLEDLRRHVGIAWAELFRCVDLQSELAGYLFDDCGTGLPKTIGGGQDADGGGALDLHERNQVLGNDAVGRWSLEDVRGWGHNNRFRACEADERHLVFVCDRADRQAFAGRRGADHN
ncbi:hypothetical protein chiPu_0032797, partial [Chiloscyllium punctatum]|nr:hypothetical protein [Chiloscyllium punctatum]